MKKLNLMLTLGFTLLVTATARAQNNSELKGDYAFSFTGMTTGDGVTSTPFAAVGRFTADGAGSLTNGELDANGFGAMEKAVAQPFTGTYSIGADNRGVMNLNIPGGGTLAFAMLANGNAKFVEIDAGGGHGTVGSGTMEKVDTTAFSTAKIAGDYAFGVAGFDQSNNRTAMAGRFTANGVGTFTNGAADLNLSGTFSTLNVFAGTYAVNDGATGRGIMNMPPVAGGAPINLDFVFYVVNARKLFAMEMDALSPATPLLTGVVLHQSPGFVGFTNAWLNAGMVMYGSRTGAGEAGLLTADGLGTLQADFTGGCGGEGGGSGTYTVASNGRTDIRVGTAYAAAYLVNFNEAFFILPDSCVSFGFGEPQAPGTITNSAIAGKYAGSTAIPTNVRDVIFSGEFTADGASPTGNISGIEDIGAPSGPSLAVPANATYSISWPSVNGKGFWYVNGSLAGTAYVISPSKFVVVPWDASGYQSLLIFEQ
ncbi:MAG TPA: hypothetical protein VGR55_15435 [Candidatus Acidoferrum sp.]|nr:hypothetical protein [Candidatus Acidoferrum sp.]